MSGSKRVFIAFLIYMVVAVLTLFLSEPYIPGLVFCAGYFFLLFAVRKKES